jgi:hypothetical protein
LPPIEPRAANLPPIEPANISKNDTATKHGVAASEEHHLILPSAPPNIAVNNLLPEGKEYFTFPFWKRD